MANGNNVIVVDASYPFEDKLIAAYAKLETTPLIEIVYVDRGGSSGLFDALKDGDDLVRRLADMMTSRHPTWWCRAKSRWKAL